MSEIISQFKKKIIDADIAIMGLGISNMALIRFLHRCGAKNITIYDKIAGEHIEKNINMLSEENIHCKCVAGENYLEILSQSKHNYIFKSPVIRPDLPQIEKAIENGAVLTSEMELFFDLCPCKIFGVTGSDGKTTTTTLIHRLLSAHCENTSSKVWLGGNIGNPLIDSIEEIKADDYAVVELSSFQLMTMKKSPDVAVITNITPNHLDVHKDYEEYIKAKENIFMNQSNDGIVVLNAKNEKTSLAVEKCKAMSKRVRLFSAYMDSAECFDMQAEGIAYRKNGRLEWKSSYYIYSIDELEMRVPGIFNKENLLAAVSACAGIIKCEDIIKTLREFTGVRHRIEFVRELDGVKYYNSSIDSSPNRTINTLSVFDKNVVMIAGGKDKNIPYDDIGPVICEKVKALILIGPTAEKIEKAVKSSREYIPENIEFFYPETYAEAVECARKASKHGDCVVLSPASTSFDRFKNFEERGNVFKTLVMDLK